MNNSNGFFREASWIVALLTLTGGCTVLDLPDPPVADVTQQRQRRAEEAEREFDSKRESAELQAALGHWNRGDVDACQQALRPLLKRNPDHRDARLLMVEVYLGENRHQDALKQAEQALAAHPEDAQVQYTTALLLDVTGEANRALTHYQQAAQLKPDNELYAVGYQTAAQAAEESEPSAAEPSNTPDGPLQTSRKPALVVPDPTAKASEPARLLARYRSNNPPAASSADDAAKPATTLDPVSHAETIDRVNRADSAEDTEQDRPRALHDKGRAALGEGSPESARIHFSKAVAVCPDDPQIPIAAAVSALRHEQPDLAVELLEPLKRRHPDSAQLYRILGVSYYRLKDYQSSQVALRQALSLDKSSALSYFLMGCTLSKLGQSESAEEHLRKARTLNPRYVARR